MTEPESALHPDTLLSVRLGGILGRDKYTHDPKPIITELRATAGVQTGILNREVGSWIGYYDAPETRALVSALLHAFPGALPHIRAGQARRGRTHNTYEKRPPSPPEDEPEGR